MRKLLCLVFVMLPFLFSFRTIDTLHVNNLINRVDTLKFSEAKAYKMLYENQLKSNDAILKTIYYALGGLATAIIVVFGSNWWFNDKKVKDILKDNEKQIGDMKKEILVDVVEKYSIFSTSITSEYVQTQKRQENTIAEKFNDISKNLLDLTNNLRLETKEDIRVLQSNYQDQLKLFSEAYNQQNSTLQKSFDERIANSHDLIVRFNNEQRDSLEKLQSNYDYNIKYLRAETLELDAKLWLLRGVPKNTLRQYIELATLHLKGIDEFWIKRSLNKVNSSLAKLTSIDQDLRKDVSDLAEKIPEIYIDLKTSILSTLGSLST